MHAARCQQGRTCCSRSLISVIKNSRNTRPHPVRECKRVGVSAQISVESCYTDASLVLGYLMRSVFSLSWLTWGETSQVVDSTQLLGAQGTGFFHFIVVELKVLLVCSSWWGNSKSLLAKVIPREWILKDLTAQMGSEFMFSVLNTSFS